MARAPGTMDYRDLKGSDEKKDERRNSAGLRRDWWHMKGEDCADSIKGTVALLQKAQQPRLRQLAISARLYGNLSIGGSAGVSSTRLFQNQHAPKERMTYSAAQSCVDTVVAKIGENKPRPFYLTSGGNYKQQRKAQKLNKWVDGTFYENKTYDIGLAAFRDACIFGDGLVHVFGRAGKVRHERILCAEIWIDEVEGANGVAYNCHWHRLVDRDQLIAAFPKAAEAIKAATRSSDSLGGATNVADLVGVVESWHLGALNDKGEVVGGKHAVTLTSATGVEASAMITEPEDWKHPWFPFARVSWAPKPLGYWAQGLMERLQGQQLEVNKKLWLIQRSMHMCGSYKVLLKAGSKVVKESINNEVGTIINWTGEVPPQYIAPQPIDSMYLSSVAQDIERMYRESGVSEMSAASKKPAGLNSGKAIREAQDIESDRFKTIQRHNNNLYLDIADMSIALAQEMSEHDKLFPVKVPGKREFSSIEWQKDIGSVQDDEFIRQCFPVDQLSNDPASRLQEIQEFIQAGFLTPQEGRRQLDFPDRESVESLATANEAIIAKTLDAIVDDGEFSPPEPSDDLSMAKSMAVQYIQAYRLQGLEGDKLDMLRAYSSRVDSMMEDAAAAVAPAMAAPGGPQAAPMAPPQSDLLPNAPGQMAA